MRPDSSSNTRRARKTSSAGYARKAVICATEDDPNRKTRTTTIQKKRRLHVILRSKGKYQFAFINSMYYKVLQLQVPVTITIFVENKVLLLL